MIIMRKYDPSSFKAKNEKNRMVDGLRIPFMMSIIFFIYLFYLKKIANRKGKLSMPPLREKRGGGGGGYDAKTEFIFS